MQREEEIKKEEGRCQTDHMGTNPKVAPDFVVYEHPDTAVTGDRGEGESREGERSPRQIMQAPPVPQRLYHEKKETLTEEGGVWGKFLDLRW